MKNNISSTTTLAELAIQFDISSRSFTRRFKQANGITATLYWQQLKLESAKELLTKTNISIQEVSGLVGYQEQSHLTRLFKKHLNLSPKAYRLKVRKKLFDLKAE